MGDTFLADSIIQLLANTSLPTTTSVFLTDTAAAGSPLIELNFTGSNDISGLYFLGVEQSPGTWGAIGNGSTDFQSSFFTGQGRYGSWPFRNQVRLRCWASAAC